MLPERLAPLELSEWKRETFFSLFYEGLLISTNGTPDGWDRAIEAQTWPWNFRSCHSFVALIGAASHLYTSQSTNGSRYLEKGPEK